MKTRRESSKLIAVLLLAYAAGAVAEIPEQFNYQARLLDGGDLANGSKTIVFRFYEDATRGTPLYSETQNVTSSDGLISVQLGANNPTPGTLFAVFENNLPVYLELEVDGERLAPRERILAVPFAFNAKRLDGMAATDFAVASHGHDGADIVSGSIGESFIDASLARDAEILPAILADDGTGSGLDADLFDGLNSGGFLRSDTADRFSGGTLIIDGGSQLDVEGPLNVGPNANGSKDSRIQFGGPSEFLNWNGSSATFELSDDLDVEGGLQTSGILSVGTDDPANDDLIRFDCEATPEYLFWDNDFGGRFQFSDDLRVEGALEAHGDLFVGAGFGAIDAAIHFDTGTDEYLAWVHGLDGFFLSNDLSVHGLLELDGGIQAGGDISADGNLHVLNSLHFSNDSESLRWSGYYKRFFLSKPLVIDNRLIFPRNGNGKGGDEYLQWNHADYRFRLTDDVQVDGNLMLGDHEGNHSIFFYDNDLHTSEYFRWDDSEGRFWLSDDLHVSGTLTASSKNFVIDHPLDPKGKILYHASIESPDMKNVYDGIVFLEADGGAWIELPDYFQALNKDHRYQLTAVGGAAPGLHVAEKIADNRFRIAGGTPGLEVCWQVTGIRCDAWANKNRSPVEVDKPAEQRGKFIHPEIFAN